MTGVLALQGDFDKHAEALLRAGAARNEIVLVRTAADLDKVQRIIIPGGESTTVGLLLQRHGLGDALITRAQAGMPVWGTCMGMIMMAKHVVGRDQYTLGLLNITVQRNAFGSQFHSFEDAVEMSGFGDPILGVFIRAPIVTALDGAEMWGEYQGQVVAVRQGNLWGTSFHPELTSDSRMHAMFLQQG